MGNQPDPEAPARRRSALRGLLGFGNTTIGKLSARFDATEKFAIRANGTTGFRARACSSILQPGSTNLSPGTGWLTDTLTARQDSAGHTRMGIRPLQEETSKSGSVGFVIKPNENFSLTADLLRIDIDDCIISRHIARRRRHGWLACNATNSNCPIRAALAPFNVGQAQFFTNAIDTRTTGLDIVANHNTTFASGNKLNLTALVHFNKTEVKERRSQSAILSPTQLFDDTQITLVERGQPRSHHVLQAVYEAGKWQITGRGNYYGSVTGEGFTPGIKQTWGGKTLFRPGHRYASTRAPSVTVGGQQHLRYLSRQVG